MNNDTHDTRESVDVIARWAHAVDEYAPFYQIQARIDQAAAMLLRLLDRAEAAERERDEFRSRYETASADWCKADTERMTLRASLATARTDALREAADAIRGSIKVHLQIVDPHVRPMHAHQRFRDVREIYAVAVEALIQPTTTREV